MLSTPASRIAVCAFRGDLAAISALTMRSGRRVPKVKRGLSLGALMALSSVALRVRATLSRAAVSVPAG
jgi:hypothetical protein